ncbi:MAG: hypothetical protein ACLT0U_02650 [Coprococcus sp.]
MNGITTEYLTAGGSVLSEKKNGVWQHYLYDGSGQLMAIRYKVFFVKHFSLKKASEFPVFSEGFFLL